MQIRFKTAHFSRPLLAAAPADWQKIPAHRAIGAGAARRARLARKLQNSEILREVASNWNVRRRLSMQKLRIETKVGWARRPAHAPEQSGSDANSARFPG
ncbi:MAG: hypothetical protein FJX45_16935 [Alphaproteobacteria bacterium]|nr:hypothetical protein [Alphaproteobacteria bacterium]